MGNVIFAIMWNIKQAWISQMQCSIFSRSEISHTMCILYTLWSRHRVHKVHYSEANFGNKRDHYFLPLPSMILMIIEMDLFFLFRLKELTLSSLISIIGENGPKKKRGNFSLQPKFACRFSLVPIVNRPVGDCLVYLLP